MGISGSIKVKAFEQGQGGQVGETFSPPGHNPETRGTPECLQPSPSDRCLSNVPYNDPKCNL